MKENAEQHCKDGNLIKVINSIDLENIPNNSALQKILKNALEDCAIPQRIDSDPQSSYWEASYFGLDQVPLFKLMDTHNKEEVLRFCSLALIEEASFVEKSATCFTSKMTLLADRTEERMLYSLFAAEEVAHYCAIISYLPDRELPKTINPFIKLLNDVLEEADKTTLTFIIQVVLEGWGLSHFSELAESCKALDLKNTLRWFVRHEARHHGSGLILFNEQQPSSEQVDYIVEIMIKFLQLIQIGPQAVLASLVKVKGDLSLSDLTNVCKALDCQNVTKAKLNKLKQLMHGEYSKQIVDKLEKYKAFTPCSSTDCAQALSQWIR